MSIPKIAGNTLNYLKRFDLVAIAVSRDGRLTVTRNPEGAAEAFWLASRDAGQLLAKARADGGNVVKAAAALTHRALGFLGRKHCRPTREGNRGPSNRPASDSSRSHAARNAALASSRLSVNPPLAARPDSRPVGLFG